MAVRAGAAAPPPVTDPGDGAGDDGGGAAAGRRVPVVAGEPADPAAGTAPATNDRRARGRSLPGSVGDA